MPQNYLRVPQKRLKSSSLPASFLTSASQCLPASETIKTPNRDSGRLCRDAAEMFIISTAWSEVEYRKTHSGTTLSVWFLSIFFHGLPRLPTVFLSSALRVFLEVKPSVLDSLFASASEKASRLCLGCGADANRRAAETWRMSRATAGLHRGFLYAGARLG